MRDLEDQLRRLADSAPRPSGGASDPQRLLRRARARRQGTWAAMLVSLAVVVAASVAPWASGGRDDATDLRMSTASEHGADADAVNDDVPTTTEGQPASGTSTPDDEAAPSPTTSRAAPAPTATSTTPEATPTTTPPGRLLVRGDRGGWQLEYEEESSCVVLAQAVRHALLCNPEPATKDAVVGTVVTYQMSDGMRLIVAVVEPRVTNLSVHRHLGGIPEMSADGVATIGDVALAVIDTSPGAANVVVRAGVHAVAGFTLPSEDRTYTPAELHVKTTRPYGTFANYRITHGGFGTTGATGETGFYTGADGPCWLYRWFGGAADAVITDACVRPDGEPLQFAALRHRHATREAEWVEVTAVTKDEPGMALFVEFPDGTRQTVYSVADPANTGWRAHVVHGLEFPPDVESVDIVLRNGDAVVARQTHTVPRA